MSNLTALVEARIQVVLQRLDAAYERSLQSKERYEELGERIEEAAKEGATEKDLAILRKRQAQRKKENAEAVAEFNRLKARLEENREILETLKGGE